MDQSWTVLICVEPIKSNVKLVTWHTFDQWQIFFAFICEVASIYIRVGRLTPKKLYHQKFSKLAQINKGLEKKFFQKNASWGRKFFKILESKTGFKTGLLLEIFYLRKHFFEEISFLDPHLFGLTKRIFDDRIFFGS